jgi:hypothetical protein
LCLATGGSERCGNWPLSKRPGPQADAFGHPSQQASNENKGQDGLGSDSEEKVVEAMASNGQLLKLPLL